MRFQIKCKACYLCSYEVAEQADGVWGSIDNNGTWTGMIGEVYHGVGNHFLHSSISSITSSNTTQDIHVCCTHVRYTI